MIGLPVCHTTAAMHGDCRHRRAAMALNNAAVSLLLRGHFHEAAETLNDAVKIVRLLAIETPPASEESFNNASALHSNDMVRQALDRANQRVAQRRITTVVDKKAQVPVFHVLSSHQNPARVLNLLTPHVPCPSSLVAFPVTIDPVDSLDWNSSTEVNFEAAVMLYNYGLALNCFVSMTCDANGATQESHLVLLKKCQHIFQMVDVLLVSLDDDKCTCLSGRILLLRAVLLHSLVEVSINLDLDREYEVYSRDMQDVLHVVAVWNTLVPVMDHCIAAAA